MTDDTTTPGEAQESAPERVRRGGRPPKNLDELKGTVSGYMNHGLRDEASRKAWAEYMAARRKA